MKRVQKVLAVGLLVVLVLSPLRSVCAAAGPGAKEGGSTPSVVFIGGTPTQSVNNAIDFSFLKVVSYLWANGHGDMSIEHILKNNWYLGFSEITWLLDDWNTTDYTNIRAEDDNGLLATTTRMDGTNIYITVHFRQAVPIGQSIHFTLYVTIGAMATGSGDNWNGHWYVRVEGSPVIELIEGVTIPSNAIIISVTPPPTTQRSNYVEWHYTNVPAGWSLTIDLNYRLSSTLDVPLFYQGTVPVDGRDPVWELDTYNNYPPGDRYNTIYAWGCFITSGTMIINYWAQKLGASFRTDPRLINDWMKTHQGYDAGHGGYASKVAEYARANGVEIYWVPHDVTAPTGNPFVAPNGVLTEYLTSGKPIMLGVRGQGHFVVATGIASVGGIQTYTINDPLHGRETLADLYGNKFERMTVFTDTPVDSRSLRIAAHSPVELVVTDKYGRKSGYDPTTEIHWNQIPNSQYVQEGLVRVGDTVPENISKVLYVDQPEDGDYRIETFGVGAGSYKVDAFATDWRGGVDYQVFSGVATAGSRATYDVEYGAATGLTYRTYLPTVLGR